MNALCYWLFLRNFKRSYFKKATLTNKFSLHEFTILTFGLRNLTASIREHISLQALSSVIEPMNALQSRKENCYIKVYQKTSDSQTLSHIKNSFNDQSCYFFLHCFAQDFFLKTQNSNRLIYMSIFLNIS